MFFKNLTVYRMSSDWVLDAPTVLAALTPHVSTPISGIQAIGHGWTPIFDDALVHSVNQQLLIALKTEKKIIPGSAFKAAVAERVAHIKDLTGCKPGKKETREIKDEVLNELLPAALATTVETAVWIDTVHGWIVVNTASPARADTVISQLIKALDKLSLQTLYVARPPLTVMTEWLSQDNIPQTFTVDAACELKAMDESKATVKYSNTNLDRDDLREHIRTGKCCTKLAMTWNGRVSFDLTEKFKIKKVSFLDAVFGESREKVADEREQHDADFVIMTGELNNMLSDLIEAFGGEQPREEKPAETPDLFS